MQNNSYQNTMKNIELEGVPGKTELKNEDAQKLSFPDAFFDVILSNLCLHNIPTREGREKACREIVRVLKPGGVAVISDLPLPAKEYKDTFKKAGLNVEVTRGRFLEALPWFKIVKGIKNKS